MNSFRLFQLAKKSPFFKPLIIYNNLDLPNYPINPDFINLHLYSHERSDWEYFGNNKDKQMKWA